MPLTENERNILSLLQEKGPLHGQDFAALATVQNGRFEWAGPILKRMAAKGYVERGTVKTWKGFSWTIARAGQEALLEPAPEKAPVPTALSITMKNQLLWIGRNHKKAQICETVMNRTTHEALKARGLVDLDVSDDGWMQLSLTAAGGARFNELWPSEAFPWAPIGPEDFPEP